MQTIILRICSLKWMKIAFQNIVVANNKHIVVANKNRYV